MEELYKMLQEANEEQREAIILILNKAYNEYVSNAEQKCLNQLENYLNHPS